MPEFNTSRQPRSESDQGLQDLSAERAAKHNDSSKSKASAQSSGEDELIYDLHAEQAVLGSILLRNVKYRTDAGSDKTA